MCSYLRISIVGSLALLCIISSCFLIIWSIIQTFSKEQTTKGNKIVGRNGVSACVSQSPFKDNRPLRFAFKDDDEYIYCPWNDSNSISRITTCVIIFILSILLFGAIFLKKRWLIWLTTPFIIIGGIAAVVIGILDTFHMLKSQIWCSSGMQGVKPPIQDFTCNYLIYIITCCVNFICAILWTGSSIFSFHFSIKHWFKQTSEQDSLLNNSRYQNYSI